jgi:hypothetical protein
VASFRTREGKKLCFADLTAQRICKLRASYLGAYLDLLTSRRGEATQFFSLIQAQNLQVKLLVIFKSDDSLIFVFFFFADGRYRLDHVLVYRSWTEVRRGAIRQTLAHPYRNLCTITNNLPPVVLVFRVFRKKR